MSVLFWFADSSVHYFIYGEEVFDFIPDDINELWMRTTIIILMVSFGLFGDFHLKKVLEKERKIEALNIYSSTLNVTHRIINDLLDQMELIRIEALRSSDFNKDVIKCYDIAANEALMLIDKLSGIKEVTSNNIKESINPEL